MPTYKTPGVYIEEISKLPASIAPVATAIPAFIGYTQFNGDGEYENKPVRITSLLEYEEKFGGAYAEFFEVTLTDTSIAIGVINSGTVSPYILYYQLEMFFANGGGPCYIISVGTPYGIPDSLSVPDSSNILVTELMDGIDACLTEDEITLLCVPEAVVLNSTGRKDTNDKLLVQCNLLKDRFAIIDAFTGGNSVSIFDDGKNFRDEVGMEYLKYGGAYYPALITSIEYTYADKEIVIDDDRTNGIYDTLKLNDILEGVIGSGRNAKYGIDFTNIQATDEIEIGGNVFEYDTSADPLDLDKFKDVADLKTKLIPLLPDFDISEADPILAIESTFVGELTPGLQITFNNISGTGSVIIAPLDHGADTIGMDKTLYNQIKKELSKQKLTLYPCGAIAGVYASVDRNRGVWKAPANVSLNRVIIPSKLITNTDQDSLNIDATSGKSINAIRQFSGKGILVWGARTLAGNDNEWRYVPVRRFYIFAEESIKKATEFVVFEPNDANTWVRVKSMIENFLTVQWRAGALAGAKPEDAFFVKVGLGETMTSQDILEGILNIEIGMAVVRPAEFIVLKFSHKLQES